MTNDMRQPRRAELDEQVLRAAVRVVAEHGWHAFTLERIAEAAGMSRVTLYRRGVTRELLVDALTVGAAQAYQAALWPALTGTGTGAARLAQAVEAICELAEEARRMVGGLDSSADPVFHLDAPTGETRGVFLAPLERILVDGQGDGSLQVDDVSDTAMLIFNVVPRTYVHLRLGHDWDPARATTRLVGFVLAAVRPTAASAP